MNYNETAKYFFAKLIKENNLSQTINKNELKKLSIIKGISVSTFDNYYFVMDALELVLFDRANKTVTFENKFYKGCFNADKI